MTVTGDGACERDSRTIAATTSPDVIDETTASEAMPRASQSEPEPPMTLGNMRLLGVCGLLVACFNCQHEARVDVDRLDEDVTIVSFVGRLLCTKCSSTRIDVQPLWLDQRGPEVVAVAEPHRPATAELSAEQLQALRTLAVAEPRGLSGALMMMHGLSPCRLYDMERDGLIGVTPSLEERKFRITQAGRRALGTA